jgi:hypothetical protein
MSNSSVNGFSLAPKLQRRRTDRAKKNQHTV